MQKECIAMLLAGGEGSRLGDLTKQRAKPAVPFGAKYRIIDFSLSNCINSRIDTVGVLTQYEPLVLNDYIGNGQPWDLDRIEGGVHILPPYQRREGSDWYKGTANAIKQNINFINQYNPTYLLVLSGDHIYKMDYSKMLEYHKEKNADCTIATIDVSLLEASRFGIMNTRDDNQIYEFEEKPKAPKSTKASMGVYIFNWRKLVSYLEADDEDEHSSKDFGKNIIPNMLFAGARLYAFPFRGYWKDVGTIESLWEANMDLIKEKKNLLSANPDWVIYSRSPNLPPHYIGENAMVKNSIISGGCLIEGRVESSVIFPGVTIEKDAVIWNSILMPGVHIRKGALVQYAIIDEEAVIGENMIIGENTITGENTIIGENTITGENTIIGENITIEITRESGKEYQKKVDHRKKITVIGNR